MAPKAFKPPRPTDTATSTTKKVTKTKSSDAGKSTKEKTRSKPTKPAARVSGSASFSRPSIASTLAIDASDSDDPFTSPEPQLAGVDQNMEEEGFPEPERSEKIPEALLTRLLHECFKDDNTRIGKDASAAVQKYMDTFVRETIARAVDMRMSENGIGGDFVEVEDLEKLAPQLLMDFWNLPVSTYIFY